METIWIVFIVFFFHNFILTKCETENPEDFEGRPEAGHPDEGRLDEERPDEERLDEERPDEERLDEGPSEEDRKNEDEDKDSQELLLEQLDKGEDLEDVKLYSKGQVETLNGGMGPPIRPPNMEEEKPYQEQYWLEQLAGDPADNFGVNMHHYYPTEFRLNDLGRRFVFQYPYREVNRLKDEVEAESVLNNVVKKFEKVPYTKEDLKLLPVKASPEKVLSVAMQSAMDQAKQPQDMYEVNQKDILRSGDYWDSVWVEKVDPEKVLRSFQERTGYKLSDEKKRTRKPKLNSLKTKIVPGSKLYELVSVLKKSSPRLLYVINDNEIKDDSD